MTRFGLTVAVLAAGVLLWSSSASANTITINGGESPTFPPTFTTLAVGASPLTLPATFCCGVSDSFVVQATAVGSPQLAPGSFLTNTIALNTTGAGTLILWFTETDLTAPLGNVNFTSGLTSELFQGGIKSVTLSTFVSPGNGVSPPNGTPLDTATFTGIGTHTKSTVAATGSGPYSLQEVYEIVATGKGSTNLTIDLSSSTVPEPATLGLLGTALAGVGFLRRRLF